MKKKNFNGKLSLSKKTISNLEKSGIAGGFDASANSYCGVPCIASLECDPTATQEQGCNDTDGCLSGSPCIGTQLTCVCTAIDC
ncbi:hypothetical protein GTQ40_08885 [Flavobacteriaceae bacterium R38]|nr:hypothetical protein [Flavobacteriaceae bacterium R38]